MKRELESQMDQYSTQMTKLELLLKLNYHTQMKRQQLMLWQ